MVGVSGLWPPRRCCSGGGTVALFERTYNLGLVLWRGRWTNERMLSYYLQEALLHRLMARLPPRARENILFFASLYERFLTLVLWSPTNALPSRLALVGSKGPLFGGALM